MEPMAPASRWPMVMMGDSINLSLPHKHRVVYLAPLGARRTTGWLDPGLRALLERPSDLRAKSNFSSRIKLFLPVQPLPKRYSDFPKSQISFISAAVHPTRGAYRDRHGRGAGCDGRKRRF